MKIKHLVIFSSFLFLIIGCSKDSPTSPVVKDDIKPPFTIKYELLFSKPLRNNAASVHYTTDQRYDLEQIDLINSTPVWTKTVIATLPYNPYQISLATSAKFYEKGTITFNIYVNGVLHEHTIWDRDVPTPLSEDIIGIGTLVY